MVVDNLQRVKQEAEKMANEVSRLKTHVYHYKVKYHSLSFLRRELAYMSYYFCKAKMIQYEKDLHILKEALNDTKEEEKRKTEELGQHKVTFNIFWAFYK